MVATYTHKLLIQQYHTNLKRSSQLPSLSALLHVYTTPMNHFHKGLTYKLMNETFYLIGCSKQDIAAC